MLSRVDSRAATVASALLVVLLIGSCGGEGGGDGAGPTISPTRTAAASPPSPTRSLTRSPDPTETPDQPSPSRSLDPTLDPTESPEEPTPRPSSEPAEQEPTAETFAPSEEETDGVAEEPGGEAVEEPGEDEGAPSWVWWLLAALVVGSAGAIPLVVGARRRRAWRQELVEAEGELSWLALELLPGLRHAGSLEQVTGGWEVGQTRVTVAEDRLIALESTAPDEDGRERARSLRDAARQARARMEQLIRPGSQEMWALDLDSIIADLELALRPSPGPSTA
jgi:hypothetical protein